MIVFRLTWVGLRSLVLRWRRFFGFTSCTPRDRSSSARLVADEPKPSEPMVVSSSENAASFSESKLISNPESEPSRPYKHFGSMVAKRLVTRTRSDIAPRPAPGRLLGVGGPIVPLLDKCNTLVDVDRYGGRGCRKDRFFFADGCDSRWHVFTVMFVNREFYAVYSLEIRLET